MGSVKETGDLIVATVKAYVGAAHASLSHRLDDLAALCAALDQRVTAIPERKDGVPGTSAYQLACFGGFVGTEAQWLESLRGKDAEPIDRAALLAEVVAKIPEPIPGKDAEVDYSRVGELVTANVAVAVAAFPQPQPGKDADLVDEEALVARVLGKIPAPTPGKDADPEFIRAEIANAVAALSGKDADLVNELTARIAVLDAEIAVLKARPVAPASFLVDEAGALIAVFPDGATTGIGTVKGKDGNRGASIMDGRVDEAGQLVLRMSDGRVLNAGIVRGEPGQTPEAKPGPPGRDALEIKVLPGLDETKTYPEGVCARFRGGVVRAERATDPIINGDIAKSGWGTIWDGIAEESEEALDEGRTIRRETIYTSGRKFVRELKTSILLDRGVWRDGEYQKGDTVTWDGSMWIAQSVTSDKPGMGASWRLSVKRGRDARPPDAPPPKAIAPVRLK